MDRYEGTFDKGNVQVIKTQGKQPINHDQIMRRDAAISNELRSHGLGMWGELKSEERLAWINSGGSPKETADAFLLVQRGEGHLQEYLERKIDTLEAQNAEMLKTLVAIEEFLKEGGELSGSALIYEDDKTVLEAIKAAIASAKG